MTAHLDDELLAAHAAPGELDAERTTGVERHLAGCAACRDRLGQLVAVRRALAALPPVPLPPEVLAGLQARLASGAAPAGPAAGPAPAGTAPDGPARRSPLLPLSIAAGLALVSGAVAVALHGHASDTRGGARSAAGAVREVSSARAARSAAAAPAVPAAPGAAGPLPAAPGGPSRAGGVTLRFTTGRNYQHATLAAGALDLLHQGGPPPATSPAGTGPSAACLAGLATALGAPGTPLRVLAVDEAGYDGRPALIVVVADPADPARALGLAVPGGCATGPAPLLDQAPVPP